MTYLKALWEFLAQLVAKSPLLVKFSRRVCQFSDNDSNPNMLSNGEFRLLELLASEIGNDKVIIDVGANSGDWSFAVRRAGIDSRIYAFDPMDKNVAKYEALIPTLKNASIKCFGLSDSNCHAEIYVNDDEVKSGHDSLYDMSGIGYRDRTTKKLIQLRTLDSVLPELGISSCVFMKIDVEGHELSVLKGSESFIGGNKFDFIQFEFGHAGKASRIFLYDYVHFFSKFDYRLFVIKPKGIQKLQYSPWIENRYSYGNFLAVSPLVDSHLIEKISL